MPKFVTYILNVCYRIWAFCVFDYDYEKLLVFNKKYYITYLHILKIVLTKYDIVIQL